MIVFFILDHAFARIILITCCHGLFHVPSIGKGKCNLHLKLYPHEIINIAKDMAFLVSAEIRLADNEHSYIVRHV